MLPFSNISGSVTILQGNVENLSMSPLKRGIKGYTKLYLFNPMTPNILVYIEEHFHQKGMRIKSQKAPATLSAKVLNIDLISEIQLSNLANIASCCASASSST